MLPSHPTLLWLHGSLGLAAETALWLVCAAGLVAALAAACGVLHPAIFAALWLLYLSVVSVGQAFLPHPG